MVNKFSFLLLVCMITALCILNNEVKAFPGRPPKNQPGPPYYPPQGRPEKVFSPKGEKRYARSAELADEEATENEHNYREILPIQRFRRAAVFDDKGFRDFTPHTDTRGMLYGTKSFGPNSHGGWQNTAKVEHDFWKSNDGTHRITGFMRHDRIDGGKFNGLKDNSAGIGYVGRFR